MEQAESERKFILIVQINQGRKEIVPAVQEGKQGDNNQSGLGQGQDDSEKDPQVPCSVNGRRFVHLFGDSQKELAQKKNVESSSAQKRGKNQGDKGIQKIDASPNHELRNDGHGSRQHHSGQYQEETYFFPFPADSGKSICGHAAGEQRSNQASDHNREGVDPILQKRNKGKSVCIVCRRRIFPVPFFDELGFISYPPFHSKRHCYRMIRPSAFSVKRFSEIPAVYFFIACIHNACNCLVISLLPGPDKIQHRIEQIIDLGEIDDSRGGHGLSGSVKHGLYDGVIVIGRMLVGEHFLHVFFCQAGFGGGQPQAGLFQRESRSGGGDVFEEIPCCIRFVGVHDTEHAVGDN